MPLALRTTMIGTMVGMLLLAAQATAAAEQDAAKGQAVYAAQKCSVCHAIQGKGNKANPLDGVGSKLSAEDIRKWITTPTEMTKQTKSTKKPPMVAKYDKLPAADLDALVAYMQSLK
jgi:mono/diheme cytochrome c family protein